MDDIKPGLRRLMKQPGVTIASIVTLAFSIGAVAATWSLLSALFLHPLPVRDGYRLVVLGTPTSRISQSPDLYLPLNTIGDVGSPFVNYFAEAGHASSTTAGLKIIWPVARWRHRRTCS